MPRITCYISSPISNGNTASPEERLANVDRAIEAFHEVVAAGFAPMLPALTEFVEIRSGRRLPHSTWMDIDLALIPQFDCLLRLPGESKGSDMEVEEARRVGRPVFHSLREMCEWRWLAVGAEDDTEELSLK